MTSATTKNRCRSGPYSQSSLVSAEEGYKRALALNPGYATAQENLGDVYAMLAGEAYARALRLEPGNRALPRKLEDVEAWVERARR